MNILEKNIKSFIKDIEKICRKHNVEKLFAFGSICTNNFNPQASDIDLIVELSSMPPVTKGEILLKLWEEFENLFKRKIDLLTDKPIRNPFLRKSIKRNKQLLYERKSTKVTV